MEKETQYKIFNQDNVEIYSSSSYIEASYNYHEMCENCDNHERNYFSFFKKKGGKMELLKDSRQFTFLNI